MNQAPKLTMNKDGGDVQFPEGWMDNLRETGDYIWRLDALTDWIGILSKAHRDLSIQLEVGYIRRKMILETASKLEQVLGEPIETFLLRHSPEGTKQ